MPPDQADTPATGDARFLVSDLCSYLESYLTREQVSEVYRAYLFGAEAHEGQNRLSGEPYIYHPVAVARILAGMRMDHQCLMAAILHDVIEDTETAKEQLAREFGREIAELVDGVSKLTQIKFRSRAEAQAENFRKMMLAMTKDIRVIMIKLADRLHNMRTLGVMGPNKARRIARETLDIYAPIANRLGINSIRHELEELGMAAHWPWRYNVLRGALRKRRGNRKEVVSNIEEVLRGRLQQEGFDGNVYGREKHVYSIYRKMLEKKLSLNELADVYAFRILVDSVDTCYRVLGVVHNLYRPVPGRFKDYIAIPKANGYQSLHTVLFGPHGLPIEIQIRTREMHRVAEEGIAAHWQYKDTGARALTPDAAADWLRNLLEVQKDSGNSMEFLEHVKVDLFPDEVYVFTPRGQIFVLPKGATVIDFAYAVHSDVGNQCVAARVDRRLAPLRSQLRNGQTVEIITKPNNRPNPAWLDFVVTGKARATIRSYLKRLEQTEAVELGRRLLERELETQGRSLDLVGEQERTQLLAEIGLHSFDHLLEQVGLGNRMAKLVARLLVSSTEQGGADAGPAGSLTIKGTEGMVVSFAKCCGPIPGDPIIAIFSPGRGLVVHNHDCPNLGDFRRQGQSWLDVQWADDVSGEFSTAIRVDAGNQRGMLATIAALIAEEGSNIEDVRSEERDGLSTSLRFVVTVKGRKHLAAILRRLKHVPFVLRINRVIG
ncbi:MAG: bifunctional (p)ppGpp synthetase/guanosine-3',5'-bis(diphosphate) 3'-pyrophosphohydrolase [Gammaproteobacteria bacterium]|nr:bifunctional (p)ppGpp synthetase/guanosine-3',5'-bis(diphosphate) 3'-pyrophosphohydrolase [Gammaproteobacteria bacterium]MCP5318067.1 bifunctional (p)ppGpp synthetase/guanosine-3',5'-bis(diphosphate) 3'-pyrophosphohydrolase [Chromatiaceae bacterium]MCP5436029.1 bifunctional (p)ppGpp synthetase/guanosine-3',5'-bis(diphosphate) 3'-pyrophosphohydrolase [Chromatiaceae bacterium]